MGSQIIKQPNGFYCRFSSISGMIEVWNTTPEEIIEDMVANFRRVATSQVNEVIEKIEKGEKPYYQFTKTLEEAMIETYKRVKPSQYAKIKKSIEKKVDKS